MNDIYVLNPGSATAPPWLFPARFPSAWKMITSSSAVPARRRNSSWAAALRRPASSMSGVWRRAELDQLKLLRRPGTNIASARPLERMRLRSSRPAARPPHWSDGINAGTSIVSSSNVQLTGSVTAQPAQALNTLNIVGSSNITQTAGTYLTLGINNGSSIASGGILKSGGGTATISRRRLRPPASCLPAVHLPWQEFWSFARTWRPIN